MAVTEPLTDLVTGEVVTEILKDPDAELDFGVRWGAIDWITATDYEVFDIIRDPADGHFYRAKNKHTSGATRAADKSDWQKLSPYWLSDGETISSHVVEIVEKSGAEPTPDLIVHATQGSAEFPDGKGVTVWLDDGTPLLKYEVTVRITTSASRVDDRTFVVAVKER